MLHRTVVADFAASVVENGFVGDVDDVDDVAEDASLRKSALRPSLFAVRKYSSRFLQEFVLTRFSKIRDLKAYGLSFIVCFPTFDERVRVVDII